MSHDRYKRLYDRIETALREKSKRTALYSAMKRGRDSRREALEALAHGDAFQHEQPPGKAGKQPGLAHPAWVSPRKGVFIPGH